MGQVFITSQTKDIFLKMIETKKLFKFLKKERIEFFTGVPDSVLKTASSFLESKKRKTFYNHK